MWNGWVGRLLRLCFLSLCCAAGAWASPASSVATPDLAPLLKARLQKPPAEQGPTIEGLTPAQGLNAFYEQNQYAPLWQTEATLNALVQALAGLEADGLRPEDYQLSTLKAQLAARHQAAATPAQAVEQELLASQAYLRALLHLYRGKVQPEKLDAHWNFSAKELNTPEGLHEALKAARSGQLAALFAQARPQDALYGQLQAALAGLHQQAAAGGWVQVPAGSVLKPGMQEARVALLRQRLQQEGWLTGAAPPQPELFDAGLSAALKRYQEASYLGADGTAGPATLRALNVPLKERVDQVRANLERARWLLRDTPGAYVVVDVAGYKIAYVQDGKALWRSRVQVGKPYRSTPIFQSKVTYITLNPTWTVPPTILREDLIPKARRDPGYLARNRMNVIDSQGRMLSNSALGEPGTMVRQRAGQGNSLGRMVIRFPNDYAVYLHDTPHQGLFQQKQRAFSSGCIRVERVLELAELLFNDAPHWNQAGINAALATGKTRNVSLKAPVPIFLAYWTVDVEPDQPLIFKPDIYSRDAPLLKALDSPLGPAQF